MFLAIDIGNSDVTIGLNEGNRWRSIWRMPSQMMPEMYFGLRIENHFLEEGVGAKEVKHVVISSVVPQLTDVFANVSRALFNFEPLVVGPDLYSRLPITVINPYQIGTDLVANAVAAFKLYGGPTVVVDFGTALTFTTLDHKGAIAGVAIAPGLKTALKSLSDNTAKLFEVPLEFPASALGKNTIHAIQAGLLFGYEGMVKNMLQQIRKELNANVTVVVTGGLSAIIPSMLEVADHMVPTLTLDGLKFIAELTNKKGAS